MERIEPMTVFGYAKLQAEMKDPSIDLAKRYNLGFITEAWPMGNFDLFPAGAGQVAALIKEIKSVKAVIEELVS